MENLLIYRFIKYGHWLAQIGSYPYDNDYQIKNSVTTYLSYKPWKETSWRDLNTSIKKIS